MEDFFSDIFSSINKSLELKNPVSSLEQIIHAKIPNEAKKKLANSLLKTIFDMELTECEKKELVSIILSSEGIFRNKKDIMGRLHSKHAFSERGLYPPGKANCLFLVEYNGASFGVIHPVTAVSVNDGKGEHKVIAHEQGQEISLSVYVVYEAIRFALKRYGMEKEGYRTLDNYGITVQVGKIGHIYDGSSLCLSMACAFMSSLLEVPIPKDAAFTGTLNIRGEIERVEGIKEKMRIAYLKGIKKVFIPEENLNDVSQTYEIEIIGVRELHEVFNLLFKNEEILSFTSRMNQKAKIERDTFLSGYDILTDKMEKTRVLISPVGMRDPYGRSYHDEETSLFSEGPVLTAYRRLSPDEVFLLATEETVKNAQKTKEEIIKISGKDTCHIKTIEIHDPTDYDDIYTAILTILKSVDAMLKDKEVFLAISSGTPQMHAVFIDILRTKRLNARPIQVLEPRFAKSWEDRVRPVKSVYIGFGF
ncbi:MAG: RNA repair transcriptional activator RtcR family protein [Syntrophorhabdaceae bacterium]|nr:RNA repair transcriptional activator RtcR family protein [Syntrophorhabdaceae bacterium]